MIENIEKMKNVHRHFMTINYFAEIQLYDSYPKEYHATSKLLLKFTNEDDYENFLSEEITDNCLYFECNANKNEIEFVTLDEDDILDYIEMLKEIEIKDYEIYEFDYDCKLYENFIESDDDDDEVEDNEEDEETFTDYSFYNYE